MIADSLEDVDAALLKEICEQRRSESPTLDFKAKLPDSRAPESKTELIKDVTAFANTEGGDLVFGIAENASAEADHLEPIAVESADAAVRRLTSVLEGVEPRLRVQFHSVRVDGGYVLILRIPASFSGPHWVRLPNDHRRRFVYRNGAMTTDMTYDQLRDAFSQTAALQKQARTFVAERLRLVRIAETPVRIPADLPLAVLHVIPLEGLAGRQSWDIRPLFRSEACHELLAAQGSMSKRLNLDGGVVYLASADQVRLAYTQAFRNGCVEAVMIAGRPASENTNPNNEGHRLFNARIVAHFRTGLGKAVAKQSAARFRGPVLVSLAIIRARNFRLSRESVYSADCEPASADELGDLVVPPMWVDLLETLNVDAVIQPLLDTIWQSFDAERCPYFNADTGVYAAPPLA